MGVYRLAYGLFFVDECNLTSDCTLDRICKDSVCVNPCSECGSNTFCNVRHKVGSDKDNKTTDGNPDYSIECSCKDGYAGDPWSNCVKLGALNGNFT